jgi:hypothetical protein
MYTLEQLQQKTFGELKAIGYELNVLPKGDRRYRQNWIDAIAGVNPPLLQLLELSPAEVQAQESPIIETVEDSPAAEDVQAQEPPIESKFGRIVYPRPAQKAIVQAAETSPGVEVEQAQGAIENQVLERISQVAKTSLGVEVEQAQGAIENQVLERISHVAKTSLGVEVEQAQGAIENQVLERISQVAKTSPAVEVDQLPECVECFGDGYFEDEFRLVKFCHCSSEPTVSRQNTQRAIAPEAKKEVSELTGLSLSDRFLARYSPPQAEIFEFQVDADGQLSLIDFKVQSASEPPDPDDFEYLDEFREAIARWDLEHPTSSSEHCESNSEHLDPPDPQNFDSMFAFWAAYDAWDDDGEPSSIDKPLEISLDSFVEWAPCPPDWYEPTAFLLEPSKVMEHLRAGDSSNTSDFFIPTFDAWCDRPRSDEPPDTGKIFARLPKPKPPNFPPQASWTPVSPSQPKSAQVRLIQASRNYPETIPKLFHCSVAGSSTQPARSPPGGDASF